MNKIVLVSLLVLTFTCAFAKYGGYGGWYGGYNGNGGYAGGYGGWGPYGGGGFGSYSGGSTTGSSGSNNAKGTINKQACSYAIANANRAFDQVIVDVRNQVNEWIIYSDLDAVDEISYYLANACDTKDLTVVSQGKNGKADQACKALGTLLQSILEQKNAEAFRGGYAQVAQLSEQALQLGKSLGNGCEVKLVQNQAQKASKKTQSAPAQEKTKKELTNDKAWSNIGKSIAKQHEDLAKNLNRKFENQYKNQEQSQENNERANEIGRKIGQEHKDLAKNLNRKYENEYKNQQQQQENHQRSNDIGRKIGQEHEDLAKNLNKKYENKYKNQQTNQERQDNHQAQNDIGRKIGQEHQDLAKSLNRKYENEYKNQQNQHNQESQRNYETSSAEKNYANQEEYNMEEETNLSNNEESGNEESNYWNEEETSFGEENELNEESGLLSEEETNDLNEEEYEAGEVDEYNEELSWLPAGWNNWDKGSSNEENEETQWKSEEETENLGEEENAFGEENELNEESNNEEFSNNEDNEDVWKVTVVEKKNGHEDKYTIIISPKEATSIVNAIEELSLEEGEAGEGSDEDDIIAIIQEGNKGRQYTVSYDGKEREKEDPITMEDYVSFLTNFASVPVAPRKASWDLNAQNKVNAFFDLVWQ